MWSSIKTPTDTSFSLQVSMAKMNEGAEEALILRQESQNAPGCSPRVQKGERWPLVNAEWSSVGRARVSLAINYFYSCRSKNRRDKNCTVCSTESAERTSKKKPTVSALQMNQIRFSFNVCLLIWKSLTRAYWQIKYEHTKITNL